LRCITVPTIPMSCEEDLEHVKEPGSVREVGAHVWVQCADAADSGAKEVNKDKVLDRREWRRWCCSGD